jgi:uncharacterized protein YifN (PemK superfamily)
MAEEEKPLQTVDEMIKEQYYAPMEEEKKEKGFLEQLIEWLKSRREAQVAKLKETV